MCPVSLSSKVQYVVIDRSANACRPRVVSVLSTRPFRSNEETQTTCGGSEVRVLGLLGVVGSSECIHTGRVSKPLPSGIQKRNPLVKNSNELSMRFATPDISEAKTSKRPTRMPLFEQGALKKPLSHR